MIDFLPFHLLAVEHSDQLMEWIRSWLGQDAELLSTDDWFEKGHDVVGSSQNCDVMWIPLLRSGTYVWAPPPVAADVALVLEELRKA
jgi:hypothetical protein